MEYKLETRGEAGRTSFLNVQMKEDVGVNQQAVKNRQKQGISETPWETSLRKGDWALILSSGDQCRAGLGKEGRFWPPQTARADA